MTAKSTRPLLILGIGQLGRALIKRAVGTRPVFGTTRNPLRIFELQGLGITPVIIPLPSAEVVESVATGADVIVTFPPDGHTDAVYSRGTAGARRVVYVSTTSVYGAAEGTIDDTTTADYQCPQATLRLEAESIWKETGAIILRPPGIYGPESGLHKSLASGKFKLPVENMGEGAEEPRYSSRIHVADLAGILLAMLECHSLKRNTYVVGDLSPCPLKEVVEWLRQKMFQVSGATELIPEPESVPLSSVNHTLRGNRRVDGSGLLSELGYTLEFPDYRTGYESLIGINGPEDLP